MEAFAWQSRYGKDPWEVLHRRLSVSGALVGMPYENPICNGLVEICSNLRSNRTLTRQDGRFYFCDLPEGVYDLALKAIATQLPDAIRFQLTAFKTESGQQVGSDVQELELAIEDATKVNGWIRALRFEIKDQHVAQINQWNKEVTHA